MIKWMLCAWIALTGLAYAEPFYGVSAFAGMSPIFPCKRVLRLTNKATHPGLVVLWGTFGEDLSCIKRFLKGNAHRLHLLEIHISNETCRRPPRFCGTEELFHRHRSLNHLSRRVVKRRFRARARAIREAVLPLANDQTILMLSTGLEDEYYPKTYKTIYSGIKKVWPYLIVRNPVNAATPYYPDYIELHGVPPRSNWRSVVNNDGSQVSLRDAKQYRERHLSAFAVFLWSDRLQGIGAPGQTKSFIPPLERNFELTRRFTLTWRRFIR